MYPDSRFLSFRGLTLHYRVTPPPGPIAHRALLVAAPGNSTRCWRQVVPELLRADCLCVLVDLPGFGESMCGPGVPHRQDIRAKLLWGILDVVDREFGGGLYSWHLMGHGGGAGTAVMMAQLQPDSAASLELFNPALYPAVPHPLRPLVGSRLGDRLIRNWYDRNLRSRVKFRHLANWVYGQPVSPQQLEALRAPLVRMGSEDSVQRLLMEGFSARMSAMRACWLPALVLWGGGDCLLGDRPSRRLRQDLPQAEYHLLRGVGHCAPETGAAEVCDYLRGWIRDVWG